MYFFPRLMFNDARGVKYAVLTWIPVKINFRFYLNGYFEWRNARDWVFNLTRTV